MNYECKCGSIDFFTEPQGNNIGLYCSKCGKWKKWLGKNEAFLFQHNQAVKKELTTRKIKVTVTYGLNNPYIGSEITPKEVVKDMVEEKMEDYFGDDEGYVGVEVEVIDE